VAEAVVDAGGFLSLIPFIFIGAGATAATAAANSAVGAIRMPRLLLPRARRACTNCAAGAGLTVGICGRSVGCCSLLSIFDLLIPTLLLLPGPMGIPNPIPFRLAANAEILPLGPRRCAGAVDVGVDDDDVADDVVDA